LMVQKLKIWKSLNLIKDIKKPKVFTLGFNALILLRC
jgi:hypothetical protein